jgi:hypothetical protein
LKRFGVNHHLFQSGSLRCYQFEFEIFCIAKYFGYEINLFLLQ